MSCIILGLCYSIKSSTLSTSWLLFFSFLTGLFLFVHVTVFNIYVLVYLIRVIKFIIIWQAPRPGKWIRYWLVGIARLCARDDISLRAKQVDESFLWQNVFRDSKNFFSDFSVGMKLETRKPNAPSLLPSLLHVTTILVVLYIHTYIFINPLSEGQYTGC